MTAIAMESLRECLADSRQCAEFEMFASNTVGSLRRSLPL